jgi:KDO2-lipid IV(A) lauroyltransferase
MDWLIGLALRAGFGLLRLMGPRFGPAFGAFLARNLGPITPAHRIARDNIAAAFPEKSVAERGLGMALQEQQEFQALQAAAAAK